MSKTANGYTFRGITASHEIIDSIDRYVLAGIPTGDFLLACIENDLHGAVSHADEENLPAIPAIMAYLYNECPSGCWGAKGAMKAWVERRAEQLRRL